MDVSGLPEAAEDLLCTLLSKNRVTSWKITSNGRNSVYTIRLTSCHSDTAMTQGETGQWKKKSPSQVRRDQQRVCERKTKSKVGQACNSSVNASISTDDRNNDVANNVSTNEQRVQADKHTGVSPFIHARASRREQVSLDSHKRETQSKVPIANTLDTPARTKHARTVQKKECSRPVYLKHVAEASGNNKQTEDLVAEDTSSVQENLLFMTQNIDKKLAKGIEEIQKNLRECERKSGTSVRKRNNDYSLK